MLKGSDLILPSEAWFPDWAKGSLYVVCLSDRFWMGLRRDIFTFTFWIGDPQGTREEWQYADVYAAHLALLNYDPSREPTGWLRHIPSGRRGHP